MASTFAYRPSTSGGPPVSGPRRPSVVSNPSFRSKQSETTPTSEETPLPTSKMPDSSRAALFSFNRPRIPSKDENRIRRKKRKVRPQYPADSDEKHVEYILVASFDIDRGSIMEHQYPAPIGGDEHMLAELMLPEQAHMRSQDWTMFFLHKDNPEEDLEKGDKQAKSKAGGGGTEDEDSEDHDDNASVGSAEDEDLRSVEGPPLVYVLNLVVTKLDNSVRRGAVCKAIAICTRHSFLHIYKPVLLLAIEEYFRAPVPETLGALYNAVNAMDLSLLPKLSPMERSILQASDVRDLFIEKFEILIQQRMGIRPDKSPIDGSESPTATRSHYGLPRDTHEFESVIPYNNVPIPVKIPTALTTETIGDFSLLKLVQTFSNPHVSSPQPFQTLHPHLTTGGALTHPVIVLMNALLTQKRVVFIGHNLPSSTVAEAVLAACALASGGLLRGFVRHAFPYTDLTKIDDLLKVPGFIAGVTNPTFSMHAEWWDLLCDLTTGRVRISPKIEHAPLTEGVVYFQQGGHANSDPTRPGSAMPSAAAAGSGLVPNATGIGDPTGDHVFMTSVMNAINERRGEAAIRAKFRLWILKFTRLAAAFEEMVYGASALVISTPSLGGSSPTLSPQQSTTPGRTTDKPLDPATTGYGYVWPTQADKMRELAANATRIEGWVKTRSYYNYIQDLAVFYSYRSVKDIDLQHLHDKLAKLRLGADSSGAIYLAVCASVCTDEQINQLLVVIVNSSSAAGATAVGAAATSNGWAAGGGAAGNGGLFHLALGLFHPRMEVREKIADLLGRIREHDAGRHFWAKLGGFERAAWARVEAARREREE